MFSEYKQPPTNCSHVAVAWLDENGNLHTRGIGKRRVAISPTTQHWTQEWYKESTPEAAQNVEHAIRQNKTYALTNGSYKESGSAGYCITDFQMNNINGACWVPGKKTIQSSYHSELAGILATLKRTEQLCREKAINQGHLIIAWDNIAAGLALQMKDFPKPSQNHFDLLQDIFRTKQKLPITVSYKHGEGHQATKYPGRELDKWGKLNNKMDALAKAYLSYSKTFAPLADKVDASEWSVLINNVKVCTHLKNQLSTHLRSRPIIHFWTTPIRVQGVQKPPKYTIHQISLLDTHNTQVAWNKNRGCIKRFVCKMSADQLATGKYMK